MKKSGPLASFNHKYPGNSGDKQRNPLVKEFVVENDRPSKISHLNFGLMNMTDMMRVSEIQVQSRDLFKMPSREPAPYGVLDPRLGVSNKKAICQTCHLKLADCVGHVGYIKLELPVFHIGYFKATIEILQNICKHCSRVMLMKEDRVKFLQRMRDPNQPALRKIALRKKILALCKKRSICPYCQEVNGVVKKVMGSQTLKVIHEKYRTASSSKTAHHLRDVFLAQFAAAKKHNPELPLTKAQHDLSPVTVLKLFRNIPDEDCELLWADPEIGRPERLLLESLLVPPVCIRPSVDAGSAGSNEDDLSVKLQEIIQVNFALKTALEKGASLKMVMEDWDFLQVQVAQFINGDVPGVAKPPGSQQQQSKPIRGLCQRLKGKQGRFRGNLSGKRVDFSARTVISPDPNLRIDQVGVPDRVAKIMTYPEKASRYNLDKLRQCIINGPEVHPGANVIRVERTGLIKNLLYGDRSRLADDLAIGDIVERHMEDGDIVLFNRQPSLHKLSIMSHCAKILPSRTFRFNECVCSPYNADFDGDEMNMHLPQTEEARTEALTLMNVHENLITPRNGEPLVAATQDFLTASYLLTQKNIFLSRSQLCQLVTFMSDALELVEIPPPAICLPIPLWTGKQVYSLLLRPHPSSRMKVNMELQERNYVAQQSLCPKDGYVLIRNSELLSGNLCKKTLGDGSKRGLFYILIQDHTVNEAARCMNRMAKLCARWLGYYHGFSIGLADVTPSEALARQHESMLASGYASARKSIVDYHNGALARKPGCDALQSLESELNGVLGKLRETAGAECMRTLPFGNAPRIMAECGSKGSALNISQMVACVGQQSVGGKRIANGFLQRTLPHFALSEALDASAKGFVANSFYSGLSPTEFFFHTMGGREGLVDTAVKTAETGYMARRLMKALEDLSVQYDGTVRNSEDTVVQFTYGDDGQNPSRMETTGPVDFDRLLMHVRATLPDRTGEVLECHDALVQYVTDVVAMKTTGKPSSNSCRRLVQELVSYVETKVMWSDNPQVFRVTRDQMSAFVDVALDKHSRAMMEPGEAVGAIGAQSISEPGTQMTLKTFHFAGVASMNVTLGVPRLKEIINGSKHISTPIITAALTSASNVTLAKQVKARVEKTTLGEIAAKMAAVVDHDQVYVALTLDRVHLERLYLGHVSAKSVRESILHASSSSTKSSLSKSSFNILKLVQEQHVLLNPASPMELRVIPPATYPKGTYFALQALKEALPQVIVQGIATISRAVINHDEETSLSKDSSKSKSKDEKTYHLLVEGYGLEQVMAIDGIDAYHTKSNHIIEVGKTLGIEAARCMIIDEITFIMSAYGIGIDQRHLMLLSDIMTFQGEVLGITRFGIAKMRESVLMLASFEKTTDHLFDAAVHARTDAIVGVSECIIMGIPVPLGTGLFKLLRQVESPLDKTSSTRKTVTTGARRVPLLAM